MRVAILALSEEAPSGVVSDRLVEAGHRVVECELSPEQEGPIRARLERQIADPTIDVVLVIGGNELAAVDAAREAIAPLVTRGLPGFGELVRWVSFSKLGAPAVLNRASAALCGSTLVIGLPGPPALVGAVIEQVLVPQLDADAAGTTLAHLLPRFARDPKAATKAPVPPTAPVKTMPPPIPAKVTAPPKPGDAATVQLSKTETNALAAASKSNGTSTATPGTTEPTVAMPLSASALAAAAAKTPPKGVSHAAEPTMQLELPPSLEDTVPAPQPPPTPRVSKQIDAPRVSKQIDAPRVSKKIEAAPEPVSASSMETARTRRSGISGGVLALAGLAVVAIGVAAVVVLYSGRHEASSAPIAPAPAPAPVASVTPPPEPAITPAPAPEPAPEIDATPPTPAQAKPAAPAAPKPAAVKPKPAAGSGSAEATATADEGCSEAACAADHNERECCAPYKVKRAPPSPDELPETLDQRFVRTATGEVRAQIMACGDKAPAASGTVKVHVEVGSDGTVTTAVVREAPDPALGDCVAGVLKTIRFVRTQQGGAFTYPAQFTGSATTP